MEPNSEANPAVKEPNLTLGLSAGSAAPGIHGKMPLFLQGDVTPNAGLQDPAGTAIAAGISPTNRPTLHPGCSTAMVNAVHGESTPRAALPGPMSGAAEQAAGSSIRPPYDLPTGSTQVPISIFVFQRRQTGRGSRPRPPAIPGVSQDSEDAASIQLAPSDFLSLGRVSNLAAMNPSAIAAPVNCDSVHPPTHFQPNGSDAEAPQTGMQADYSQRSSSSSAVVCDGQSKLGSVCPANTDETQGQHTKELTSLLAEGVTDHNMHKYQRMRKKLKIPSQLNDQSVLSTPAAFKEKTLTQIDTQISGLETIETLQNEETPAPKAKPRRKKHRAKVIREDKQGKKQKPVVTTPEVNSPNKKAKRSYVRKKRNLSSLEKCSGPVNDQSISGRAEDAARSRSAAVRRRLQFELGELGVQGDQSSTGNSRQHVKEKLIHAKSSLCSATNILSTAQSGHGLSLDMENLPGGLAFGMSRELNKPSDEYKNLPEITPKTTQEISPATSGCCSREPSREQENVGITHDLDATSMGLTIMEGNNKDLEVNYSNKDGFYMHRSCTSIPEKESTDRQVFVVSKMENKEFRQRRERESSLTGPRDSIIMRTAAQMIAFCQAGGVKKKRSVRVRKNIFIPVMDIAKNNAQTLTRLPQSCMEALYESSCIRFMTKKRSQRGRSSRSSIQPNVDKKNMFSSGNSFIGSLNGSTGSDGKFQQTLLQAQNNRKPNLDISCEAQEKSSEITSSAPYMNFLQKVASRMAHLNLNTENVHANEMHPSLTTPAVVSFRATDGLSNSLVPFGGQMIVPYERPLNLVKKQRPRAKVNLDFETTRVWNLLMGKATEPVDGTDVDKERWWQQEREVFEGRANSFIARMRLVQGDRHFSPWKGSVVDSVVGVFLTQNVSDHLSSSAYMALAASFPPVSVNSSCKDDITSQGNEEIIRTSVAGGISMFDFFYNSPRPDLGENFEEQSVSYKKVHVETGNNTSAYELTKGENYSFYSKEPNESFCDHQETVIDQKAQNCPDFSIELITSMRSPPDTHFQNEMSSQSVIVSETILQSLLSSSPEKSYTPRSYVGGGIGPASQQLGSNFDGGNSLAGNGGTTKELECQRIQTTAVNDDGIGEHGVPSTSMMYCPFISVDPHQADVTNELYVSSTSPNSSSGSAASLLKNGTTGKTIPLFMPSDNHTAQKNCSKTVISAQISPVELHCDKSTGFEAPDLQEHESLSTSSVIIAETANGVDEFTPKSGFTSYSEVHDKATQESRNKKTRTTSKKDAESFDWDKLRRQACDDGYTKERIFERRDSVDWEAVRCADVHRISHAIRERGMNNVLAQRIQSFLNRLVKDHGSIDLEWLRDIAPDSAKDYLLSIRGLGLKSVECVRLLTLHHLAFPVDTNVGRICVRLGWVPIQPLPESLQLHLLELYPVLATIQKYLWPRLCKLDQQTLYELHYHMITFGKVFCTKSKPNCNACPLRSECRHFASAFASSRLALPAPEEKSLVYSSNQFNFQNGAMPRTLLPQLEGSTHVRGFLANNSEPIIEEPASPRVEEHPETLEKDIEDYDADTGEIPVIKLNLEAFAQNLENCIRESNKDLQSDDIAKALVAISTEAASIPVPKLKNVRRLRTEHYVYELPDSHSLVQQLGLDQREPDDPSPYLLTIWMQDDIKEMSKAPKPCCDSQMKVGFCNNENCQYCVPELENQSKFVRGTILVPCRTAMKGSFPLNGTYFQVNEVFADHESSHDPIYVVREQLWNLERRMVYFGTSVPSIFKGLTTEEIQQCFWRGFVCVRGFDMETRAPRPLCPHLHLAASKLPRSRKSAETEKNSDSARASIS